MFKMNVQYETGGVQTENVMEACTTSGMWYVNTCFILFDISLHLFSQNVFGFYFFFDLKYEFTFSKCYHAHLAAFIFSLTYFFKDLTGTITVHHVRLHVWFNYCFLP